MQTTRLFSKYSKSYRDVPEILLLMEKTFHYSNNKYHMKMIQDINWVNTG